MNAGGFDLEPLLARLGHRFATPTLLGEALTHPSASGRRGSKRRSYERLEFLGDRVLGLVVAEMLWSRFPDAAEGELTRRHTSLVRREALIDVARKLELGRFLILSSGEAQAGTREQPSVLADSCEAVIAALYLDGGLEVARAFVRRHWEDMIESDGTAARDPKTELQEWAQARGLGLPTYKTVDQSGPAHRRQFTVTVLIQGAEPASASGNSKRAAEIAAAAVLLERLRSAPAARRAS
jgi:ribonuclease III